MGINIDVKFSPRFEKITEGNVMEYADKALVRTIVEGETICIKEAPIDKGTLRRSIGTSHPNMGTVCLTCGVKYWYHNQYGTSPHVITPRNPKGLLAWKGKDGEKHFAKKVNHPGTKANPFVTRTAQQIKSKQLIQRNLYDVLKSEGIIQ